MTNCRLTDLTISSRQPRILSGMDRPGDLLRTRTSRRLRCDRGNLSSVIRHLSSLRSTQLQIDYLFALVFVATALGFAFFFLVSFLERGLFGLHTSHRARSCVKSSMLFPFLAALGGTLTSSPTRSSSQDLEVFNINADRSASVPRYYRFEQLLALPQTTVKTATDPNTQQPATYTGVYLNELIQALQSSPEQTVLGANCYDGYQQYYDPDYNEKHHPIFLLKYDGKSPADWPKSEHNSPMGPLLCRA
jgi:hypothetical protein